VKASELVLVGVFTVDGGGGQLSLARAAAHHPRMTVRSVSPGHSHASDVVALIVDAPVEVRAAAVAQLATAWPLPILVESPVAVDAEGARSLANLADDARIVSVNPLFYGLHTRRLLEEVGGAAEPLETIFAAWRIRPRPASPAAVAPDGSHAEVTAALACLVEFVRALAPAEIERISALARRDPLVVLATLRDSSGTLINLEVGSHLPASFPSSSELIVECFSTGHAYHCAPGAQSVTAYADALFASDWQPDPADAAVSALAAWLQGAERPYGTIRADLDAFELADQIKLAAQILVDQSVSLGALTRSS
jgi:hypothetical protein